MRTPRRPSARALRGGDGARARRVRGRRRRRGRVGKRRVAIEELRVDRDSLSSTRIAAALEVVQDEGAGASSRRFLVRDGTCHKTHTAKLSDAPRRGAAGNESPPLQW